MEEEVWALEEAYFSHLYAARYEEMRALVHDRFLGWPDSAPHPIDNEGSTRFMRALVPAPTPCTFVIEREGIRVQGGVALTHYLIHVNGSDIAGATKTQTSRITHTWVNEGAGWKLLGGMSYAL